MYSVFILCFLCSCYQCRNEGLFSGCFLTYTILNSWCKALNKAIKRNPISLENSFMYWTRKVVQCSLKRLFDLFKYSKASMLNYNGKLFQTAFPLQAAQEWLDYTLLSGWFFLEPSEISSVRTAFHFCTTVTDVHRPRSPALHETKTSVDPRVIFF